MSISGRGLDHKQCLNHFSQFATCSTARTCIDAFDDRRIQSSVVPLSGLYPSMGPEVVWDSQVKKKRKKKSGRCCRRLGKQTSSQTVGNRGKPRPVAR
ncbi:unnamed protein product [Pleuronectes platessa]|uniref:Uncharacterized protein n=1 Tax=Pleuronectes platessa TaxID=8262 RepID=A0A9N7UH67_PLEPL|nr:unnamed protein product [Pleuronectes platessa]